MFVQVYQDDCHSKYVCIDCWKCILNFHELYLNVEQKHKSFYDKLEYETKNELVAESNVEYFDIKVEPINNAQNGTIISEQNEIDEKFTNTAADTDNENDQEFVYNEPDHHISESDDDCKYYR